MSTTPNIELPSASGSGSSSRSNTRYPFPTINLPSSAHNHSMDEEKWTHSPVASARSYISLRKRRAIATVGSVLTLVALGGWWTCGFPDMPTLMDGQISGMSLSS